MKSIKNNTGTVLGFTKIALALVVIGFFGFGFEVSDNPKDNLFYNFMVFLVMSAVLISAPFWHKMASKESRVYRTQCCAVLFVGWFILLELFFIGSWVKDLMMVWQPDWVKEIIDWMHANITLPPLNEDKKLFALSIGKCGASDSTKHLFSLFSSEQAFLDSEFGRSAVFFHFLRAVAFFPLLVASIILVWDFIVGGIKTANSNKLDFVELLMFVIISSFLIIITIEGFGLLFESVEHRAISVVSKGVWLYESWWIICFFILIVIGLRFIIRWLIMGKNIITNINQLWTKK